MKFLQTATLIAAVLLVSACTTGDNFKNIHQGMSRVDVVDVMGDPDGIQAYNNTEEMTYYNRLISGWAWDRADYKIILNNSRVIEYGAENFRDGNAQKAGVQNAIMSFGQGMQQYQYTQPQHRIELPVHTRCSRMGSGIDCYSY